MLFLFHPALAVAAGLGFVASIGYAASLPLQERLVDNTSAGIRGQVLGLNSAGVTAMQGVAAVLAGLLTERLAAGRPPRPPRSASSAARRSSSPWP